jgi:hypothetical protein
MRGSEEERSSSLCCWSCLTKSEDSLEHNLLIFFSFNTMSSPPRRRILIILCSLSISQDLSLDERRLFTFLYLLCASVGECGAISHQSAHTSQKNLYTQYPVNGQKMTTKFFIRFTVFVLYKFA